VIQRYQPPRTVLASVKEKLAPGGASKIASAPNHSVLDQVVEVLSRGRGYSWVGIYLAAGEALAPGSMAATEAESAAHAAAHSSTKLAIPIKIALRTMGVIEVEAPNARSFSRQEQALLGQVAEELARYLTTNQGKLLSRRARAATPSTMPEVSTPKNPQAQSTINRVAAGQRRS